MASEERYVIESMFQIADKERNDVPFILNEAQSIFDDNFTGRDLVPKPRQIGVSSYVLAKFAVRCLSKRNTRAVVISHDRESTERLFKRVKYFLDNLRGPKAKTGFASKREFTFPKTNSMFYVGTAGTRKFGRGDTITDLHCSEIAFWPDAKELFSGLSDAVPRSGTITLESTGNGKEFYFRRIRNALAGKGRYTIHFFNWLNFSEYNLKVSDEEAEQILSMLDAEFEEDILVNKYGATAGQVKFFREKLEEKDFDLDLFKQEYPKTLEECFRSTGNSIFHKIIFQETKKWQRIGRNLHILEDHPKRNGIYGMGVDTAAGIGHDQESDQANNTVIQIIDLEELEQVGEWVSNRFPPDAVGAEILPDLAREYNNAFITVEANNHGLVVLDNLRNNYDKRLIFQKEIKLNATGDYMDHLMDYGLLQTTRLKPLAIGKLRRLLATGLIIHSPLFVEEADTFVEHENGSLAAADGEKDDRIMAMAAFAQTYEHMLLYMKREHELEINLVTDPFIIGSMLDELRSRGKRFPIASQVGGRYEGSGYLH